MTYAFTLPMGHSFIPTNVQAARTRCRNSPPQYHQPICQQARHSIKATSPSSNAGATPPISGFNFSQPGFQAAVSGEWFGQEVTFSSLTGTVQAIEERFVPDEFRAWGVQPTSFDTVTSTQVRHDKLHERRTRALPSVGCEADAVIPDVREGAFGAGEGVGFEDGSYCVASPEMTIRSRWSVALTDGAARARVQFGRVDEGVGTVTIHMEKYGGAYCNGEILPGCGGDEGFGEEHAVTEGELQGMWNVRGEVADGAEGVCKYAKDVERRGGEEEVCLAFPRGVSVGVVGDVEGGTCVVVGWLRGEGKVRHVMRCWYGRHGHLKQIAREVETKFV